MNRYRKVFTDGSYSLTNDNAKRRLDFGFSSPEVLAVVPDLFLEETCSQRRRRTTFTVQQQIVLQRQFAADQYLTLSVRKRLAASLDLTERAVKVWFQNRRAKLRRQEMEEYSRTVSTQYNTLSLRQPARLQFRRRLFDTSQQSCETKAPIEPKPADHTDSSQAPRPYMSESSRVYVMCLLSEIQDDVLDIKNSLSETLLDVSAGAEQSAITRH